MQSTYLRVRSHRVQRAGEEDGAWRKGAAGCQAGCRGRHRRRPSPPWCHAQPSGQKRGSPPRGAGGGHEAKRRGGTLGASRLLRPGCCPGVGSADPGEEGNAERGGVGGGSQQTEPATVMGGWLSRWDAPSRPAGWHMARRPRALRPHPRPPDPGSTRTRPGSPASLPAAPALRPRKGLPGGLREEQGAGPKGFLERSIPSPKHKTKRKGATQRFHEGWGSRVGGRGALSADSILSL